MKRIVPIVLVTVVLAAWLTRTYWLAGEEQSGHFLGYVEGETTLVAPPVAGRLATLDVRRGQTAEKDAPLFSLDQTAADAEIARARSVLKQAEAQLANLETGKRKEEQDVVRAQRHEAEAALTYAEQDLRRTSLLVPTGATSRSRYDQAASQVAQLKQRIASLRAQEAAGDLGGRSAERDAAEAKIRESEAVIVQAAKARADNAPVAPAAAHVEDTFFLPGEWVPSGSPVVSLLRPEDIKLRFFVPQAALANVTPGTTVAFACDGCAAGQKAVVNYVASRAEFTPPVIYSNEARAKLMFLVEAKPLSLFDGLRPGLPVDVSVLPEAKP